MTLISKSVLFHHSSYFYPHGINISNYFERFFSLNILLTEIKMAEFDIAHINEQGEDIILIPLDSSFAYKSQKEQMETVNYLQACAEKAGLKGKVIPVWKNLVNRMDFVAPEYYHPYLFSINYSYVLRNINRKLVCE